MKDQRLRINGEEGIYEEFRSCDHILTPTKKYIIENIAELLQQDIEPCYTKTATDLSNIKKHDEASLLEIFGKSDLI